MSYTLQCALNDARARENRLYTHYLNLRMALETLVGGPDKVPGREAVVYPIAEILDKHLETMAACGYDDPLQVHR